MSKLKVEVRIVPTEGKPVTKTVSLEKSGASLKEVLQVAGISGQKMDLLVNNKPATLETHIGPKDIVDAKKVEVKVSERPQGS